MNCNPNCHCGLSAWEVRGAVAPSPADWLTCGSADTLTVRDRDCPRWLLRSGTYRARPDHPGLGGPSPARAARSRSSLPYHSKTGLVMALRSMSHFPIQETLSRPRAVFRVPPASRAVSSGVASCSTVSITSQTTWPFGTQSYIFRGKGQAGPGPPEGTCAPRPRPCTR